MIIQEKKEKYQGYLKIGYYNGKSLLNVLNGLNLTKFEFENAIKRIEYKKIEKYITTGIIFENLILFIQGILILLKKLQLMLINYMSQFV